MLERTIEQLESDIDAKQAEINAKRSEIDGFDKSDYVSEEQYDDMLNDCYGEVEVAGMTFSARRVLEELDNTAYRCGYNDYVDSIDLAEIDEYRELEEQLEELEGELEELEEQLEEAEEELEEVQNS